MSLTSRCLFFSMLASSVAAGCAGPAAAGGDGTDGSDATDGSGALPSTTQSPADSEDDTASGGADGGSTTSPATDGTDGTSAGDTDGSEGDGGSGDGSTTGIVDEDNVLHVRSDGADSNPGTQDAPLRTIQWALATAADSDIIDTIRVAEGNYGYDFANAEHIVMVQGVSLLGGYRDDWGARDPALYATNIVDETTDGVATSLGAPHRAVEVPADVTASTVLEGFVIGAAHGQYRMAIWAKGAATIRDNVMTVDVDDGLYQWGLYIDGADALVTGNRFGWIGTQGIATAIEAHGGDPAIANNVVDLTGLVSFATGLRIELGSPTVVANTIAVSGNGFGVGIFYSSTAAPVIDNNVIEASGNEGTCLRQSGAGDPASLRNNVLDCGYTMARINLPTPASYTSIAALQSVVLTAQDNLKLDAPIVLNNPDFALDGSAPCTVARGGLDISGEYPQDIEGIDRTDPLSIGAHEWDPACL